MVQNDVRAAVAPTPRRASRMSSRTRWGRFPAISSRTSHANAVVDGGGAGGVEQPLLAAERAALVRAATRELSARLNAAKPRKRRGWDVPVA
jgi:hypothetical protein